MTSSADIAGPPGSAPASMQQARIAAAPDDYAELRNLTVLIAGLIAAAFLLDLYSPDSVAGALPYVLPVWVAAISGRPRILKLTVGLCVILVLSVLFWQPVTTASENWHFYTNRALAILAIVTTAGVHAWTSEKRDESAVTFPSITYIAPLMTLLILLVISWSMNSLFTNIDVLSTKEREIIRLSGEVSIYDEILTSSAMMAAATGDRQWIDRYSDYEAQLAEHLQRLTVDEPGISAILKSTGESNNRLVLMEKAAIELVDDGELESARKILTGQEYQERKRQLAGNLKLSLDQLLASTGREKRATIEKFWAVLAIAMLAGLVCLPIWAFALRALSRWKTAEISFRREITRSALILEERNRELEEFNYIASHDLRAPLRAIENLAGWVREDAFDSLPTESQDHISKIQQRVKIMRKLLDDLLSYSRAGRVEGESETVDSKSLIHEAISMLEFPENVSLSFSGDFPQIDTLVTPLKLCIRNLVDNSLKHNNKANAQISISCLSTDQMIEISVSDNGSGIPLQNQERIFRIFQTLEKKDETKSTGIGLALVRKAAIAHGGNVSVESVEGEGATFKLRWPRVFDDSAGSGIQSFSTALAGDLDV